MPVPQLLASVFLGVGEWGGGHKGEKSGPLWWLGAHSTPWDLARASPVKEGGQEAPQQDLVPRACADMAVHELCPCDVHVGAWKERRRVAGGPKLPRSPHGQSHFLEPPESLPNNSPQGSLVRAQVVPPFIRHLHHTRPTLYTYSFLFFIFRPPFFFSLSFFF